MAGHSRGTSLQQPPQRSTKLYLKAPPAPLPPLTLIKGQAGTLHGGQENNGRQKTSHLPTIEDQHLKQSPLYSHFFSETWDRFPLSQLVTPTQALRCKEIQYSPLPAGRRASFCLNQDKPPCTLRWLRTLVGPNADTSVVIY
jgi:hypothetical protein